VRVRTQANLSHPTLSSNIPVSGIIMFVIACDGPDPSQPKPPHSVIKHTRLRDIQTAMHASLNGTYFMNRTIFFILITTASPYINTFNIPSYIWRKLWFFEHFRLSSKTNACHLRTKLFGHQNNNIWEWLTSPLKNCQNLPLCQATSDHDRCFIIIIDSLQHFPEKKHASWMLARWSSLTAMFACVVITAWL
jgi:hypothetical protein